jgi:hypothetical protein
MRVAWTAQRPRTEERPSKIGAPAASARQDALRWALQRPVRSVEDAGSMQGLVGVRCPFDIQLVASRAVESVLLIRTYLRLDIEGA